MEEKPNMQRGTLLKRSDRSLVLVSLLVALVLLVGCAPRATGGEIAAAADESEIVVDLPAIVLDVQPSGDIQVGGQSLSELGSQFGAGVAGMTLPPETVQALTASNIQHIQVDNTSEGLLILVNGAPIPSLAWDGEKLVATADVLESLGAGYTLLDKVLPLITQFGVGLIVRFPLAEGAEPLELVSTNNEVAAQAIAAQEEFLAAVGEPPVFQMTIAYAPDGTWAIADVDQAEWSQLLPVPLDMLNLTPATIQGLTAAGITEIGLATNADGIFLSINGETLPYITWADGRVNQLLVLAEESGLLTQITGNDPNMTAILDTVESLLPAVQASEVSLRVTFS
jgi:hypothetical protein